MNEHAIAQLSAFAKESGHQKIVWVLRAAFEKAFKGSGRQGILYNDRLEQFVPEAERNQSNSKAENTVQTLVDILRTYRSVLETNVDA